MNRMVSALSPGEEAQLVQTIEMFEVITQSQPNDIQSLEILREAYSKLNREKDLVNTSKRIAQAYVQMGQLSSAILEYESILQRHPDDPDVQAALRQIESKAETYPVEAQTETIILAQSSNAPQKASTGPKAVARELEDGRRAMHKIFVDGKIITAGDFDLCWSTPDLISPPNAVVEPFIQVMADKGILTADASLKVLCDKSRLAFLPLKSYEVDMELARSFPKDTCRRWCVLPFDRMSKSLLVATANPFNQEVAKELAEVTNNRLIWYLVPPAELVADLRKVFR
ncbi:MAG TPA: tetratricopeptide repeat protein [Candidatus Paceibacterota bacterium]|nr:tetratricopeptide repeat protein [Verrucomicrobiota bacterium]HSA09141.1 tetratricopeptide repeat protein [Candidatus Paceibacterota bacterium]